VALLVFVYARGRRPVMVAAAGGPVQQILPTAKALYWLETAADGQNRLMRQARPGGSSEVIPTAPHPLQIAAAGSFLYVLEGGEQGPDPRCPYPQGSLSRIAPDGQRTVLVEGLVTPSQLLAEGDTLYWSETYPARAPGVPHVPALQYLTVLKALPQSGGTPKSIALVEGVRPEFEGQLLGAQEDFFYWAEQHDAAGIMGSTQMKRAPLAGGSPVRLAAELADQRAARTPEAIYWTAPSPEAMQPFGTAALKKLPYGQTEPILLTDWLFPGGTFLVQHRQVYYHDGTGLWRLRAGREPAILLEQRLGGRRAVALDRGLLYAADQAGTGDQVTYRIVRRPVSLGGWIRNALRPGQVGGGKPRP